MKPRSDFIMNVTCGAGFCHSQHHLQHHSLDGSPSNFSLPSVCLHPDDVYRPRPRSQRCISVQPNSGLCAVRSYRGTCGVFHAVWDLSDRYQCELDMCMWRGLWPNFVKSSCNILLVRILRNGKRSCCHFGVRELLSTTHQFRVHACPGY